MYYILLLICILIITLIFSSLKINIKKDKRYLFATFLILTLFLGLRDIDVGLDMGNYHNFFDIVGTLSVKDLVKYFDFELGFKFYTKIITVITNNFSIYIFLTSVISMVGIYFFIKENSKNYFASTFIFITFSFYIYLFCTLRQAMATSFLLLAFNFLKKEKNVKFFLLVIFASLFHKTSIVFLMLYFIKKIPYNKKLVTIYLVSCLTFFIFKEPLIDFFTEFIYSQYVDYRDTSGSGYKMLLLLFGIIISLCYLFKFDKKRENKILIYMLLTAIPFQILSTEQGLVARIVLYFTFSLIVLIPNFIEQFNKKHKKTLEYLYYIFLTLFYLYEIFCNPVYMPYSFLEVIL